MNVALVELAEPVPFASVPPRALPGGRRPFLPGSTESWVGTHLLIDTGNTFGLRIEEATPDSLVLSSLFAPCEAIPGTPIRWSSYFFDSHYAVPLTEMLVGPLSTESCQDGYRAEVAAGSSLASWVESMLGPPYANVELTYWRPTSAYLSPSPLGNQLNALTGFAPYGTSQNHCYYLESTYDLEPARDFVTLRETRLSGSGEFRTHQCGLLPVYVETDAKNASVGVTFEASHPFEIDRSDLEGEECHITDPEGWPGCEHPCAVCVELLQDYPAYFDNNPRCALDTACGGEPYTPCSPRCPPPSEADR
jgi:hypothetical protein